MVESMNKDQGKKEITEVKTSPVPFPLEEINETITPLSADTIPQSSEEQIINQAFQFDSEGNTSEAAKYFQNFIDLGFKDQRVYSRYGEILKDQGKLNEAEKYIKEAIKLNPNNSNDYKNIGSILIQYGQLDDAQIYTEKAIKLNPDFDKAYLNLGVISLSKSQLNEAELYTRKAIELNPDLAMAHSNLGIISQRKGNLQDAELSIRKAIELNPESAMAHSNLGSIFRDFGKLQDAELSFRKAIEIKPDFAMAYSNLGLILKDLGKLQEAEFSTQKAIELNPNYTEAKMNLDLIVNNRVAKWHIPMMNDDERNNAYLKAINRAIKGNEYVLEIGTGSGLLSMMACDAGAKKVIACEASVPISEAANRIIARNGYSDKIEVKNKKSTELNVGKDLENKADLIISEIISSEFVGEGVQSTLLDANQRLIQNNGRMIPEAGEIKIALLESNSFIEKELFVQRVNGYDLSEFNDIMGQKFDVNHLSRQTDISFLSEAEVPFYFNFYSKEIQDKQEKILEIEVCKSGICLGLITWLKINLYEDIYFENQPDKNSTSGWVNPIYKFNQPLKVSKGEIIKVKATLLDDRVWYEFI